MREGCWNCVRKHVSQAMVLHEEEVCMGYPEHIRRVIGHLAEASSEVAEKNLSLAAAIRNQRLGAMEDITYYPPYNVILDYVDVLESCENNELTPPDLPEALEDNTTA